MNTRFEQLKGLMTAILTPFDLKGELALEHMPALIEFQRQAGIDGLVVCGTNGEGTALSVAERKQVLETVMTQRGDLKIVAGTGATSVTDAVELTRHAAQVGADAVLVLPPFFSKNPSPQGLADYFQRMLDAVDLPVLLYNIPQFSAVAITDELLGLLEGHPNLAGIKDSAGEWARTQEFIVNYPELRIFVGSDRLDAPCYEAGGAGCISGGANAFPELLVAVRDASFQGPEEAEQAQIYLNSLLDITARYPFLSTSKSILTQRGLPRLGVRPPITVLQPEKEAWLFAELREAGFLPAA
ncbi:MAG: Dihydrodipicolinate synthase/N-acetylneuraminate lyase [Chthonomonadaceae bacterium]|nr:Dihydrodipicolinate synthase/N-acetylneuraminate lyase [Chthonomonadaceae bacterium]